MHITIYYNTLYDVMLEDIHSHADTECIHHVNAAFLQLARSRSKDDFWFN